MRVGIIDLGSNSARFDVHDLSGARSRELHHEKLMIRLGQGVFKGGKLHSAAIRRAMSAIADFKESADLLGVEKIFAFGTSALRDASDADQFVKLVRGRFGIQLEIISGKREAELIALGILALEKVPAGSYALVDIGGGSTEVSICRGKRVLASKSFDLGTARLQQLFLKRSPPKSEEILKLRQAIQKTLRTSSTPLKPHLKPMPLVIGSSGTIRAVAKLIRKNLESNDVNSSTVGALNSLMSRKSIPELEQMRGMESKRTDMILAGSVLFEECLCFLRADRAITTELSLRDGMLRWVTQNLKK